MQQSNPKDEEMSQLKEAVKLLEMMNKKYEEQMLAFRDQKKYGEALRIKQIRLGIQHSINIIAKMEKGRIGIIKGL